MHTYAAQVLEPQNIGVTITCREGVEHLRLSMERRRDFYLIFKEAVNNISKYAACTSAHITLSVHAGQLVMIIADNGKGFEMEIGTEQKQRSGNGLSNMRWRADHLKGVLKINTGINMGTQIELKVPIT
jgi:signal transduction histidine kinase